MCGEWVSALHGCWVGGPWVSEERQPEKLGEQVSLAASSGQEGSGAEESRPGAGQAIQRVAGGSPRPPGAPGTYPSPGCPGDRLSDRRAPGLSPSALPRRPGPLTPSTEPH